MPFWLRSSSSDAELDEKSMRPNERSIVARGSPTSYAFDVWFAIPIRAFQPPWSTCMRSTVKTRFCLVEPYSSRQPSLALCGLAAALTSDGGASTRRSRTIDVTTKAANAAPSAIRTTSVLLRTCECSHTLLPASGVRASPLRGRLEGRAG